MEQNQIRCHIKIWLRITECYNVTNKLKDIITYVEKAQQYIARKPIENN